ncbi:MAG: hypothetical protein IJX96_01950 [Clostridia bacterium]|nr:hypothetical protein [Clostridia bacterium]
MKKIKFIFGLHGVVFSIYTIVNMMINKYFYALLESWFSVAWLINVFDFISSVFLYMVIYTVVYFAHKIFVVHVKKEVFPLGGNWYHLHIKFDEDGNPKPNGLRAGTTEVKQDLYEVHFFGNNRDYELLSEGKIKWKTDESKDTDWESWSVDWDGKKQLNTCFKAKTQEKTKGEYPDRYGIHKLMILEGGKKMRGSFADEYPSKSRGDIYFFRTEKALYEFIQQKEQKTRGQS